MVDRDELLLAVEHQRRHAVSARREDLERATLAPALGRSAHAMEFVDPALPARVVVGCQGVTVIVPVMLRGWNVQR